MARRTQKSRQEAPATFALVAAKWRAWLPQALLILAVGIWVYWPALGGGWIWDDEVYITRNPIIHDPDGFWKVWINRDGQGDYYPLTSFVEWTLWNFLGNATPGWHIVSLALHLTGAFLIWRLFAKINLQPAWIAALLFTIYPRNVESVAWINELKNTLSLPPLLLAMLLWLRWKETAAPRLYYGSLACFVVSLLAKCSGLMLPFILLGHAWWTQRRITRADVKSAAPFLIIAVLEGIVMVYPHGSASPLDASHAVWTLPAALAASGYSFFFFLGKSLVPYAMLPVYSGGPEAFDSATLFIGAAQWLAIAILFLALFQIRAAWARVILAGLAFFAINLVPFLAYIFLKYNVVVWSMDHAVYISSIGLIGIVVAGLGWLKSHASPALRWAELIAIVALVSGMALSSHLYAGWFLDSETLWKRTLQRDPNSWIAQLNMSSVLLEQKRYDEARGLLDHVAATQPGSSEAHLNLGIVHDQLGQTDLAALQYQEAIRLQPANPEPYLNLGEMYRRLGKDQQAQAAFEQGLKAAPDNPALTINLAGLLLQSGHVGEAIAAYKQAIARQPRFAPLHYNLGAALLQLGDINKAADHFATAIEIDPNYGPAHASLGTALARAKHLPEAIQEFQAAIAHGADTAEVRDNLALALLQSNRIPEALQQFQAALHLDPNDSRAKEGLSKLR